MESEPIISEEENFLWVKSINNIACSMSVNEIKPIMSGFLKKEGKILKSWKKRFFSMMGNGIYYFENENANKSLGVIVLKPTSLVIDNKEGIRIILILSFLDKLPISVKKIYLNKNFESFESLLIFITHYQVQNLLMNHQHLY